MKNIFNLKNTFLGLALVGLSTSCIDDEQTYNFADKPVITVTGQSATTITEGDKITVNLEIAQAYKTKVDMKLELVSGTGSNDDYFVNDASGADVGGTTPGDGLGDYGYKISFPANQTTHSFEITATADIWPEDTEDLVFKLRSTGNGLGTIDQTFSLTIDNLVTTDFFFNLDWETEYVGTDEEGHSTCDYDLDIEVYDTGFNIVETSYGSCPEEVYFSMGDLADGDYYLVPSLWDLTGAVPAAADFDIPATLTFAKPGVWVETVDHTGYWKSNSDGAAQGNGDAYLFIYQLTVSGSTYTVTNFDTGDVIGTGKMASTPKKSLPANFVGGRQ